MDWKLGGLIAYRAAVVALLGLIAYQVKAAGDSAGSAVNDLRDETFSVEVVGSSRTGGGGGGKPSSADPTQRQIDLLDRRVTVLEDNYSEMCLKHLGFCPP